MKTKASIDDCIKMIHELSNKMDILLDVQKQLFAILDKQIDLRVINEDRSTKEELEIFKDYFSPQFNGRIPNSYNYFSNNLVPDLLKKWNGKEFATISLLIYSSSSLLKIMKPKSFSKWHVIVCSIFGNKIVKYHKGKLNIEDFRERFSYLF